MKLLSQHKAFILISMFAVITWLQTLIANKFDINMLFISICIVAIIVFSIVLFQIQLLTTIIELLKAFINNLAEQANQQHAQNDSDTAN